MASAARHSIVAQLARGIHATALRFSSTALGLIFGILATRVAGSAEFGEYISIMAIVGLSVALASLGLPQVLAREIAAIGNKQSSTIIEFTTQLSSIVFFLLLAVGFMAFLQNSLGLALCLLYISTSFALSMFIAVLNGSEKVIWGMWLNGLVKPGLALSILAGSTVFWKPDANGLLISQFLAVGLTASVAVLFLRQRGVFRIAWPFANISIWGSAARRTLITGVLLASTQALIGLTTQLDVLILTAFRSPEEVAHYYAAARAALVVSFFAGSAALVMEPTVTRLLAADDNDKAQDVIHRTALSGFLISAVVLCCAIALAPYYLSLYGPSFLSASSALYLLSGSFMVFSLFGPAESTLRAGRLDSNTLLIVAISIFTNTVVSVILVFQLGVLGVAIGSATQFIIAGSLMMLKARWLLNLRTGAIGAFAALARRKCQSDRKRK